MRHLIRLEKPQKLVDREVQWTQGFIASGNARPNNKQYAHQDITAVLGNISHYKCFYSEVKFAQLSEAQVDHHLEVAEDKTKAFEWDNLYLSHKDSNMGKSSNLALPNASCLNPFVDEDVEIEKNLDFEDEIICGLTQKGVDTIKKYKLDKSIYNTLRAKELKKFDSIARAIAFSGKVLDEDLKNVLKSFALPDKPFSLMFKKVLVKNNIT